MSELKYQLMLNKDMSWVPCYLKSEADKEIARLNDKALHYKVLDKEHCRDLNTQERRFALQIAHQKYKRCLAMVRWCEDATEINHNSAYEAREYLPSREDYFRRREEHYERWRKRWLKLAEQFKPNNSTDQ